MTTVLLVVGTAFTYYRFFKGRTFTKKLNIQIHVKVLPLCKDAYLHAVDLRLINVGSIALWNLQSSVDRELISSSGKKELIENKWHPVESVPRDNEQLIIEPQETYSTHETFVVPHEFIAATYKAEVKHPEGSAWARAVTVSNQCGLEHKDS